MSPNLWNVIREYIAVEIQLGLLRHGIDGQRIEKERARLEEQSTRMDDEIRRLADLEEKRLAGIASQASSANSHFVRY